MDYPKTKVYLMVVILLEYHLKNKYGRNERIAKSELKMKPKKNLNSYINLKQEQRKRKLKKLLKR